jgi:hypothetical protein
MAVAVVQGDQWVYHPEKGSKLIWCAELGDHIKAGWFMTPDDFPENRPKSADKLESEILNDFTKRELYVYGRDLGVKLDWKDPKDVLVKQIESHLGEQV